MQPLGKRKIAGPNPAFGSKVSPVNLLYTQINLLKLRKVAETGHYGVVLVSTAMGCIRITGMQLSLNCKRKELTIISIIANYRLLDSAFAPKQYPAKR